MSFEHKYLKYKQKYLELKKELSKMQVGGSYENANNESSDIFDIEKLTETPSLSNINNQKGGFATLNSSSESLNSDVQKLTENLSDSNDKIETEVTIDSPNSDNSESSASDDSNSAISNDSENISSDNTDEQEGGNDQLDTSISELDEIFSQLGGDKKKKGESSSESDSDLSSLSSLEDSSSEFDL